MAAQVHSVGYSEVTLPDTLAHAAHGGPAIIMRQIRAPQLSVRRASEVSHITCRVCGKALLDMLKSQVSCGYKAVALQAPYLSI